VRTIELLDPAPDERILEIGCGSGVAAALICKRLQDGHLTAIDRSSTAIARASRRNAAALAEGKLDLRQVDLAGLAPENKKRFDAALAVNVNLFWTGPADIELTVIRQALRPDGRLVLVYETPRGTLSERALSTIDGSLRAHGFVPQTVVVPPVAAILAQPNRTGLL
jgi:SAM-dependent methyltransferase